MPQAISATLQGGRSRRPDNRHPSQDVLLTVKEVAALDRCSEKTVRRAIDAGLLKATRIGVNGRLVRVKKSDHAAYRVAFSG